MKALAPFFLFLTATLPSCGTEEAFVIPIYSEFQEHVDFIKGWSEQDLFGYNYEKEAPDTKPIPPIPAKGGAWAITLDGQKVLLTAAHVLGRNTCNFDAASKALRPEPGCLVKRVVAVKRKTRVIVGGLAFEPAKIAQLKQNGEPIDLAVLLMQNDAVFDGLKVWSLSKRRPFVAETVTIAGCPGSARQQVQDAKVSEVFPQHGHFTLNNRLIEGFSGGVVKNKDKEAYGLISGVDGNQTTVLLLTTEMLADLEWQSPDVFLSQTFDAPNR